MAQIPCSPPLSGERMEMGGDASGKTLMNMMRQLQASVRHTRDRLARQPYRHTPDQLFEYPIPNQYSSRLAFGSDHLLDHKDEGIGSGEGEMEDDDDVEQEDLIPEHFSHRHRSREEEDVENETEESRELGSQSSPGTSLESPAKLQEAQPHATAWTPDED
eukprot:2976709-Rhodomonas_salina.1